jgi:hypothetical protein
MADRARVHIFGGPPALLQSRDILLRMAQCLTDADVTAEAETAATYDLALGGDDALVGCHMTLLIHCCGDPREYVERSLMACDLLRRARRTAH